MIKNILDPEQELENQLEILRDKGFDVSEDSNINRILTALIGTTTANKEYLNSIISKLTFDGRSGDLLDELYGFFGIPRIIKNVNSSSISFFNGGNYTVFIGANTIFQYQGNCYRTTTSQYINPKETKTIYAYPTGHIIFDSDYIDLNDYKIVANNIKVDSIPESNKFNYLQNNALVSNFNLTLDKESDLEYKARAKGLIQHFGDGSISKIKSYIMGIENVTDVKIEKEFSRIKIIIIPEELRFLNKIMEQAKEAVDYFSSYPIIFEYPTITQLNISGISKQLSEWFNEQNINIGEYISGIKKYLDEYAKDVYLTEKNIINRDSVEFAINKYFADNNIVFSLNEKQLKISYSIYSDEDYSEPIIKNELDTRQSKEVKTDIIIIGDVS